MVDNKFPLVYLAEINNDWVKGGKMIANILRRAARYAGHFIADLIMTVRAVANGETPLGKAKPIFIAEPHRHVWQTRVFSSEVESSWASGLQELWIPIKARTEWCPGCGKLRPPQPQGKAWDLRREVRLHYPGNIRLQRKWIKAWKRSPGPMVPISTTYVSPPHDPSMGGMR